MHRCASFIGVGGLTFVIPAGGPIVDGKDGRIVALTLGQADVQNSSTEGLMSAVIAEFLEERVLA